MAVIPDLKRGPVLLAISISTGFLALATCVMRFFVKKRTSSHVGLDDYAIGMATLVGFIGTIFSIIEGSSMGDPARALEFDWLGQPWFMMGTTFAKISICFFFIRLIDPTKQWRIVLSSQILLMVVLNFAFFLTTSLQCQPLEKLWDPSVLGDCWNPNIQVNVGYFQGAFSVFWWLFLSLFPVMIFRDLDMHMMQRWPFYFLSSIGLLAGIFAAIRTYETSQTVPGVYTIDTFFAVVLSVLEQNFGLVAANILPMGHLLSKQRDDICVKGRLSAASGQDGLCRNSFASVGSSARLFRHGSSRSNNGSSHDGIEFETSRPGSRRKLKKHNSMLVIEGSHKDSFCSSRNATHGDSNTAWGVVTSTATTGTRHVNNSNDRGRDSAAEPTGSEPFWPRGIIKTVEVEVIEEDISDVDPQQQHHRRMSSAASGLVPPSSNAGMGMGGRTSRNSLSAPVSDWATMLRLGPMPPGTRGPSRQG